MKKFLFLFILAIIITSCMPKGFYNVVLQNVEKSKNAKDRYVESKIVNFEEEGKTKYSYEDDIIKIVWVITEATFEFTLNNKTDHSISLIWTEAVYTGPSGSSGGVMNRAAFDGHSVRNIALSPHVIVENENINDVIFPNENTWLSTEGSTSYRIRPLFSNSAFSQKKLDALTKQYIGKEVRILLPLKIEETIDGYILSSKVEYIFNFKVKDYIKYK